MALHARWLLLVAFSVFKLTAVAGEPHVTAVNHDRSSPHHTLGVFVGDTTEGQRANGVTLGLEYEYRLNERFGIGAIAEHVWGDFNTNVYVLPVAAHYGPWKIYAGAGVEDGEHGSEPLFRVGIEYGFHTGGYEISPQIDVDFVGGEELVVFGIVIARPF